MSNLHDELLVDVDEVLADWHGPALDIAEKVSGKRYDTSKIEHWDILQAMTPEESQTILSTMAKPGFASTLKPAPGAQDFLRDLKKLGPVRIVTAQFVGSPTWCHDRTEWLQELFDIEPQHIIFTHAKESVGGRMLLDDKPANIIKWRARYPKELPVLWHRPNTAFFTYDGIRSQSWSDVLCLVENHLYG
jgi:5'(3')-deoxyribonucleotidase